jgi:hypothetical protein
MRPPHCCKYPSGGRWICRTHPCYCPCHGAPAPEETAELFPGLDPGPRIPRPQVSFEGDIYVQRALI